MADMLSIEIDALTMRRLEAIARSSNRPKSTVAAEAIAAYLEGEEWQLSEIQAAADQMDCGETGVDHEKVTAWLRSWGTPGETNPPE